MSNELLQPGPEDIEMMLVKINAIMHTSVEKQDEIIEALTNLYRLLDDRLPFYEDDEDDES